MTSAQTKIMPGTRLLREWQGKVHEVIVRGRNWFEQLTSGRVRTFLEIAEAEGVTGRYVAHLVPLAFLAPELVARILSGTQPVGLTTETLTKRIDLPLEWAEQRALLGFD